MSPHLVVAALLAALLPTTAGAQDKSIGERVLARLFPPGEPVCYARFYDAAHLKAHPTQSVTSARLMRGYQQVRHDERRAKDDGVYAELVVTYRDSGKRRFLGGSICKVWDDGTINCSSDRCDGGSFPMRVESYDTILIGGGEGRSRFTVSGGCGDGGPSRSLGRKADDTVFRLSRMPIKDCR